MTHTIPKEKAPGACDTEGFTNQYNNRNSPTTDRVQQRRFATLAAQFALAGYSLIRSNSTEGAVAYYAMRWGYLEVMPTLDAANVFLMQIGGMR